MSDRKKAIETLKENLCAMCTYGPQNMESCDIRSCDNRDAIKALEQEPKIGHCKDCKWWKDKDGVYRREVFEGNGYCYMFEPQESEET